MSDFLKHIFDNNLNRQHVLITFLMRFKQMPELIFGVSDLKSPSLEVVELRCQSRQVDARVHRINTISYPHLSTVYSH